MYKFVCFYTFTYLFFFLFVEHVLNGVTKDPISLYNFRLYVLNKEHSAENLEFHYWYQSYKHRFSELPQDQQRLSGPPAATLDPEFSKVSDEKNYKNLNQPFREEVEATIKTYFNTESLKALCLPPNIIEYTIYSSNETTHPDVFEAAYEQIYNFMQEKSLKQFIHQAVQNVRYGYIVFQYTCSCINLAMIPMFLFNSFSMHMSRWSRLFLFMFTFNFFLGFLSGRAGFCILRSLLHVRQVPAYMILLSDQMKQAKSSKSNRVDQQDLESNQKPIHRNLTKILDYQVIKFHRVKKKNSPYFCLIFHFTNIPFFFFFVANGVSDHWYYSSYSLCNHSYWS